MANENGHIYAPVGIGDVKDVLREKSNDVGTLCMSENINPYSLIRPMPINVPWISVEQMRDMEIGNLKEGNDIFKWVRKKWGYQVPYVTNPALIDNIKDVAWYRPNADLTHYKNLNHFDGYLHNVEPMLNWAVGDLKAGDPIIVIIGFGAVQRDIVSASGKGNNGGVVSALEVFGGETFYYGVKIEYNGVFHFAYGESGIAPGSTSSGVIMTGLTAQAGTSYRFTPFICNKQATSTSIPQGLEVYNLKYAPDFDPTESVFVPELTVGATIRVLEIDYNEATGIGDGHIKSWAFRLFNEFSYPYETEYLTLVIREQTEMGTEVVSTMSISADVIGESSFRVEAQSDKEFVINREIMWPSGAAGKSATITGRCVMTRVPFGNAVEVMTNQMRMTNPQFNS